MIEGIELQCPYCGELIPIEVDRSGGRNQRFIEDCSVCCRPIQFQSYEDEDGEVAVSALRDSE